MRAHSTLAKRVPVPAAILTLQSTCITVALTAILALILNPHAQGARLYLLPAVREGHELAATFVFPSLEREYRAKAEDYVSHFVGHEGAGSLLSTLKARACGFARSPGLLAVAVQRCADFISAT